MSFEFDCELRPGETPFRLQFETDASSIALVGPSGAGKTSVLNAIAGLLRPEHGRIVVQQETLFDSARGIDIPPERRGAGYVFQDARLFPHLRVAANLSYGLRQTAGAEQLIGQAEAIELLEIANLVDRWPATLSGGEIRRVAIGRALLSAPRFLLLDEPLAGLDADRGERLKSLIERIRDELAIPVLLVSHSAGDVKRLAHHVVEMP